MPEKHPNPGATAARRSRSTPVKPIRYTLKPTDPAAHLFRVSVHVDRPDPKGQRFRLPTWIPGSYMVREFARHIVSLDATCKGRPVAVQKTDKATWHCTPCAGPLTVTYEVYAWDLSVRAAHLDTTHGFFNGTSVFLLPLGMEAAPCELEMLPPDGDAYRDWAVATSLSQTQALARVSGQKRPEKAASAGVLRPSFKSLAPAKSLPRTGYGAGAQVGSSRRLGELGPRPSPGKGLRGAPSIAKSFGTYVAANYDELIDHPVEMGTFSHVAFEACGVTHHIAITGRHRADLQRLAADLQKICEAQIRLFEPQTAHAPMAEYWFLVMAVGDGYGGLEHRASTALITARDDLPAVGATRITEGYRRFLGLASHEYFHTWNVKRIKPAAFVPYDLTTENYTRQLWFFEGITSYYDDLMLVRTRLIEPLTYLEMMAETIGRVHAQAGRLKQSVAESSFDAWIKYYRQDENSPNAIVSYYQKGSFVGLALDLTLRKASGGKHSLDDLMRLLWQRYGKAGKGVPEGAIEQLAGTLAGADLAPFFAQAVHGTEDLDLKSLFESVAVDMAWRVSGQLNPKDPPPATMGVKVNADTHGEARLATVHAGSAAMAAGLSAGDIVIAIDGLRVNASSFERHVKVHRAGTTVAVTAFRRDELMHFKVRLAATPPQVCALTTRDTPIDAKARRNSWLLG